MNTQAGHRPAYTSASADPAQRAWPDQQVVTFAHRCKSLGATQRATRAVLHTMEAGGIRRLLAYTDRVTDRELISWLQVADARLLAEPPQRRGDVLFIRTPPRWPWRTSTGSE